MKRKTFLLLGIMIIASVVLSGCMTGPRVNSVPSLTATDSAVYVSYGQYVQKVDTTNTNTPKNFTWHYPEKGSAANLFFAPVLVDGENVIFGDFTNTLNAVKDVDGTLAWQFKDAKGWYQAGIVKDGDYYYAANFDRNLYKIKANDQSIVASYADKYGFFAPPLIVDNLLVISSQSHQILALDKDSLKEVWSTPVRGSVLAAPYYDEASKTLTVGNIGNEILVIDAQTGTVKATINNNGTMSAIWTSPVKAGEDIVAIDDKGIVYMIDPKTASLKSSFATSGPALAGVLATKDGFVTANMDGTIRYFNNGETKPAWTQTVHGYSNAVVELSATPVLSGETLVFAGLVNNRSTVMLWGYDLQGNLLWSFPPEKK